MKLFVTDLDGTFLNTKHQVEPSDVPVVKELQQSGCEFVVCTGRNIKSIKTLFQETDLEFTKIALNGSIIMDKDDHILYSQAVDMKDIKILFERAKREDIPLILYSAMNTYSPNPLRVYELIAKHWTHTDEVIEDPVKFYEEKFESDLLIQLDSLQQLEEDILKLEFQPYEESTSKSLYKEIEEMPGVDVSTSGHHNIEITHINAQKGLAVQFYCKLQGYDEDDALVVGDSYNDISMLSRFQHSYAMGQADDRIKKIANFEAKRNDEEGALQLIQDIIDGRL